MVAGVSPLFLQNPYLCWAHSRNRSVPSKYSFSYILALRFEVTSGLFSSITVIKSISNFLLLYCTLVLMCGTRKSIGSIVISRNITRINRRVKLPAIFPLAQYHVLSFLGHLNN